LSRDKFFSKNILFLNALFLKSDNAMNELQPNNVFSLKEQKCKFSPMLFIRRLLQLFYSMGVNEFVWDLTKK